MSSPTLLALVTEAFGGRGGIAQYNRELLSALAFLGSEGVGAASISVLPRYGSSGDVLPAFIRQAPPRRSRIAYALLAIGSALTRRVNIVYCGHLYMAPLASLIARMKGARLIIQAHGIEAWSRPSSLQRAALETADLVLCVSRYTRARVLDWADMAPERVLVLPNTVRDSFKPGDAAPLRSALGLEGKRILVTVGRMETRERYKGHDLVIAGLSALVAKGHNVAYVIIGDGDDRGRLETLARDSGISERVHFLGAADPQRIIDAYRMADLFVMPSKGEGFGIAFLEAMACGTPVLGLAVAGTRDALADGALGTLTSEKDLGASIASLLSRAPGDPHALAQAVRARFGRELFNANVKVAIQRLSEAA